MKTQQLDKSSTILKTYYTGESLQVLGAIKAQVKYEDQRVELPVLVIKGHGPNLLGQDWLTKIRINWRSTNQLRSCNQLQQLLDAHASVFEGS